MSYYYSPLDEARIVGAFIWVIGIVGWVIVNLIDAGDQYAKTGEIESATARRIFLSWAWPFYVARWLLKIVWKLWQATGWGW